MSRAVIVMLLDSAFSLIVLVIGTASIFSGVILTIRLSSGKIAIPFPRIPCIALSALEPWALEAPPTSE
ncbi:unknown [Clostridium sp. CAG:557]|nr:unknown [Clostridium sp. CAG:557]